MSLRGVSGQVVSTPAGSFCASPQARRDMQRQSEMSTSRRLSAQLCGWAAVGLVLALECFCLDGSVGSWLAGEWLSSPVRLLEFALLAYVSAVIVYLARHVITPWMSMLPFGRLEAVKTPVRPLPATPAADARTPRSPSSVWSSPPRKTDWVDSVKFGSPALASPAHSAQSSAVRRMQSGMSCRSDRSPNASIVSKGSPEMLVDDSRAPLAARIGASHQKQLFSIHTQQQVDRLLRNDGDLSMHETSNSSFGREYLSLLDLNSPIGGEKRAYQLSEKLDNTPGSPRVRISHNGRVHLSPAMDCSMGGASGEMDEATRMRVQLNAARKSPGGKKSSSPMVLRRAESCVGGERRRRSCSSPERDMAGGYGSGDDCAATPLPEAALAQGEHKLRVWIGNTIIRPLNQQIAATNALLDKDTALPHVRVGVSSVHDLNKALLSRPSLLDTQLPYLLPYLSVCSNQAYLVSRVSELASDPFMKDFRASGGGCEPVPANAADNKSAVSPSRAAPRVWSSALPSDSELVFGLFCAYMDARLTSTPVVCGGRIEQPFSSAFVVRSPCKPTAVQQSTGAYYIHVIPAETSHPQQWELCVWGGGGARRAGPHRSPFRPMLQLVHEASSRGGRIQQVAIGSSGLNIACVLE